MNNTLTIDTRNILDNVIITKKIDILKIICDIFFCIINIYKLLHF